MGKLKTVSGLQIIKALEHMGFERARQRGSHIIMKKLLPNGAVGCVVPMHKEVAIGTLFNILKQAQISTDDFLEHLK